MNNINHKIYTLKAYINLKTSITFNTHERTKFRGCNSKITNIMTLNSNFVVIFQIEVNYPISSGGQCKYVSARAAFQNVIIRSTTEIVITI